MTKISNFYCNQKFWWLTVDLDRFNTSTCCSASPVKVDIDWTKNNPGKIFNTPIIQNERKMMLENQLVESCRSNCWKPEFQGITSRRLKMKGDHRTHVEIDSEPEMLNIMVGTDCNMTCVYCCKQYSTAWRRDVEKKFYDVKTDDDRFIINIKDRIQTKLSQKDLDISKSRNTLLEELSLLYQTSNLREVHISGGEPFLYLDLEKIVNSIPSHVKVSIFSGLGVDEKRFFNELSKFSRNVNLIISAENVGESYEFVRYGNTWQRFLNNIATINSLEIPYRFNSTVSNITLPGLLEFIKYAENVTINFQPCTDPDFLSINVLDDHTKKKIKEYEEYYPDFVKESIKIPPTAQQVKNFRSYVIEYAQRRFLDLKFLPKSMIEWIQQ